MTTYAYITGGEVFHVDDTGRIARPSLDGNGAPKFYDMWRITGAVRFNNFGHKAEYHPFPACMSITEWRHKNGKPKWHLCDADHRSARVQMSPGCDRTWTVQL
jgi:hypothetical protein